MDEKDSERALRDLGARLHKARGAPKAARDPKLRPESSGYGQAFRVGTELVSALVVGVGIGWFLDKWLGTKPWMMILFIFLGGATGILNVYRAAIQMTAARDETDKTGSDDTPETDSGINRHEN